MNVIKTRPSTPEVLVVCLACSATLKHSDAYADLDGPAFRAYYHADCRPDQGAAPA
jgi:hypothetical protein